MDLLTNAVESIQVGVEDYRIGTRPRLLSAVRNIHAGILLLYKEALLRRSPAGSNEVLLRARTRPVTDSGGNIVFLGEGRKTVDTQQIREHFDSLGIGTDWTSFNAIAVVRNDVEHYCANITKESLQGVIASAFLIIRSFAATELEGDPLKLLGHPTWQLMLDVTDVYEAERHACDEALRAVDWGSETLRNGVHKLRCEKCGSDLLRPAGDAENHADVTLTCRVCGDAREPEVFIPLAVDTELAAESYMAVTDGAEEPLAECPECGVTAYVMAEIRTYCEDVIYSRGDWI